MGIVVDTNVLIRAERGNWGAGLASLMHSEEACAIATISLSELMMGVHLADTALRAERRTQFIQGLLGWLAVVPLSSEIALNHAILRAGLRRRGHTVGGNDLIIAATAKERNWSVLTHNVAEFKLIHGLDVLVA